MFMAAVGAGFAVKVAFCGNTGATRAISVFAPASCPVEGDRRRQARTVRHAGKGICREVSGED